MVSPSTLFYNCYLLFFFSFFLSFLLNNDFRPFILNLQPFICIVIFIKFISFDHLNDLCIGPWCLNCLFPLFSSMSQKLMEKFLQLMKQLQIIKGFWIGISHKHFYSFENLDMLATTICVLFLPGE